MRIAHVIVGLDVGGAENMLKRLLLAQASEAERFLVISLTSLGPIGHLLRQRGVRVETASLRGPLSVPRVLGRVAGLLRKFRPDIVQTWMYHADILGGLAARLAGIDRVVWGIRNSRVPAGNLRERLGSAAVARLSRILPRRIVCAAEAGKARHVAAGFAAEKMRVIPNGFDFDVFDRVLEDTPKETVPTGTVTIGCVGRFHADKGQDVLIRAAARLLKQRSDARFLLIGRGCSPDNEALMDLLERHSVLSSFTLLGERDDVPECLAQMDVFCMPSRSEAFPNALAEAMAMKRMCVATDTGDARQLAADNVILVAPDNAEALAAGLEKAIGLPAEERRRIGERAGAFVREHFSLDAAVSRFTSVYDEVLEECR